MSKKPYYLKFWWLLVRSLFITPLIVGATSVWGFAWWYAAIPGLLLNTLYWYRYNIKHQITTGFKAQVQTQLLAFCYYFGLYAIMMIVSGLNYLKVSVFYPISFAPYNLSAIFSGGMVLYDFLPWLFIGSFWSGILGIWIYHLRIKQRQRVSKMTIIGLIALLLISLTPVWMHIQRSQRFIGLNDRYANNSTELSLAKYQPFDNQSQIARLNEPATLKITRHYPRINGATAVYAVESAVATALYHGVNTQEIKQLVKANSTPKAFDSLLKKQADVIFMADPSDTQKWLAKKARVSLRETKIANEAFIFFVNKHNPVDNLSIQQIQDIYQRKLVSWSSVGGRISPIQAFQRPLGSGSQTAMKSLVMRSKKLASPLRYQEVDTMGGIVDDVAGYNNTTNAIGYSFRFYATQMKLNKNVKILKVNGIMPTTTNIRNGKYPFIAGVYAIRRGNANQTTRQLVDWITSAQGQSLINKTGYVGLK